MRIKFLQDVKNSSDGDTSETQLAGGRVCVGVHTALGELSAGSGLEWLQTRKETGGRRSRESVYARRIRFELSARLRRTAPTTFDIIKTGFCRVYTTGNTRFPRKELAHGNMRGVLPIRRLFATLSHTLIVSMFVHYTAHFPCNEIQPLLGHKRCRKLWILSVSPAAFPT